MRNLPTLLAAVVVVAILGFYMCTYQVRFTEVAIKKTFGEPDEDTQKDPGLYVKWPWPVQSVVKFDRRIRVLEDRTEETITADSKNVIITTATMWNIEEPYKFHRSFPRGVEDGEKALREAIRSEKKAVVGQYDFANFVSTHKEDRKLREIEGKMLARFEGVWLERHGVEIRNFGITKLTLPQSVTEAIFDSMKKAEQNKAATYKAEGAAQADQIVASANATRERILAVARRRADEIRNEGEREVSEIYKEFQEYPELRIFLDKINALGETFRNETTLILDPADLSPWPMDLFPAMTPSAETGISLNDRREETE